MVGDINFSEYVKVLVHINRKKQSNITYVICVLYETAPVVANKFRFSNLS